MPTQQKKPVRRPYIETKSITRTARYFAVGTPTDPSDHDAGLWRDVRPVWNRDRCFRCGMCYVSCPDAAIVPAEDGFYQADTLLCKGCGICAETCWNEAISMQSEQS